MKKVFSIVLFFVLAFPILFSQEVRRISDKDLQAILNEPSDKLHIINFWATWCGPCITEIPHFERAGLEYRNENVEFLMASLDFPSQLEKKLIPFIKKQKMTLPVVLIEESDYDKWIRSVDPNWQGNIPVTLFFNNARNIRRFESRPLEEKELLSIISDLLTE